MFFRRCYGPRCRFGLLLAVLALLGPAPLVEVAYSSPASSPSNLGTQVVVAPGVITQLHLFFDDLFPHSLGQPLFGD